MDTPPQGIIIGPTFRYVRDVMVPAVVAATSDHGGPTVSMVQGKITWPNGHVAYLHSADQSNRLRGLSVGWAFVGPLAITDGAWAHLRMALREKPGTIVGVAGDVAALVA